MCAPSLDLLYGQDEDRRTNSEAVARSLSWRSKKAGVPWAGGSAESVLTPNDTSPNEVL